MQQLHFALAAVKRYPTSKVKENQMRWWALREGIRGQTDWNHNHRQLGNLITQTTALSNSMKVTHAMCGHPRWTGHRGEVWQNVAHWRREWQTTQYSCLENPMNSMKRQKYRTLKDELPKSVGAQYATGDQWRNNFRMNERMEPKQKLWVKPPVFKWSYQLKQA